MEIAHLIEIIANFGFPVACVIALGIFVYKLYQQSVTRENKLYSQLDECRKINKDAVDTIGRYAEKLEAIQGDIGEMKEKIIFISGKID